MSNATDVPADSRQRLMSASFIGLLVTQLLGAVNDNVFRWLVIGIGKQHFSAEHHSMVLMAGNGMSVLDDLEGLDVPVYVSEPRQLSDIGRSIRDYGTLAGTRDRGEREAARIDNNIGELQNRYGKRSSLSVLYQVWHEPLQTLNGKHLISSVIRLCGGHNIFADALSLAPKISIESVLQRDPDVIVASGMDIARPEWLDLWLDYPSLTAVQNQALFFIHPDHIQRPTARLLLGAQALCRQLDSVR